MGERGCAPDLNVYAELMTILTDLTPTKKRSTGIVCPNADCGWEMPQAVWANQRVHSGLGLFCLNCGEGSYEDYVRGGYGRQQGSFWLESAGLRVAAEAKKLLNKRIVKKQTWYHATFMEDWATAIISAENAAGLVVHLGTKDAAQERAADMLMEDEYYLYEVTLDSDVVVSDSIMSDDNRWPDLMSDVHGDAHPEFQGADAVRYVNRYEAPGSISLAVNANRITVKKRVVVKE
jgi:hypothetical protein